MVEYLAEVEEAVSSSPSSSSLSSSSSSSSSSVKNNNKESPSLNNLNGKSKSKKSSVAVIVYEKGSKLGFYRLYDQEPCHESSIRLSEDSQIEINCKKITECGKTKTEDLKKMRERIVENSKTRGKMDLIKLQLKNSAASKMLIKNEKLKDNHKLSIKTSNEVKISFPSASDSHSFLSDNKDPLASFNVNYSKDLNTTMTASSSFHLSFSSKPTTFFSSFSKVGNNKMNLLPSLSKMSSISTKPTFTSSEKINIFFPPLKVSSTNLSSLSELYSVSFPSNNYSSLSISSSSSFSSSSIFSSTKSSPHRQNNYSEKENLNFLSRLILLDSLTTLTSSTSFSTFSSFSSSASSNYFSSTSSSFSFASSSFLASSSLISSSYSPSFSSCPFSFTSSSYSFSSCFLPLSNYNSSLFESCPSSKPKDSFISSFKINSSNIKTAKVQPKFSTFKNITGLKLKDESFENIDNYFLKKKNILQDKIFKIKKNKEDKKMKMKEAECLLHLDKKTEIVESTKKKTEILNSVQHKQQLDTKNKNLKNNKFSVSQNYFSSNIEKLLKEEKEDKNDYLFNLTNEMNGYLDEFEVRKLESFYNQWFSRKDDKNAKQEVEKQKEKINKIFENQEMENNSVKTFVNFENMLNVKRQKGEKLKESIKKIKNNCGSKIVASDDNKNNIPFLKTIKPIKSTSNNKDLNLLFDETKLSRYFNSETLNDLSLDCNLYDLNFGDEEGYENTGVQVEGDEERNLNVVIDDIDEEEEKEEEEENENEEEENIINKKYFESFKTFKEKRFAEALGGIGDEDERKILEKKFIFNKLFELKNDEEKLRGFDETYDKSSTFLQTKLTKECKESKTFETKTKNDNNEKNEFGKNKKKEKSSKYLEEIQKVKELIQKNKNSENSSKHFNSQISPITSIYPPLSIQSIERTINFLPDGNKLKNQSEEKSNFHQLKNFDKLNSSLLSPFSSSLTSKSNALSSISISKNNKQITLSVKKKPLTPTTEKKNKVIKKKCFFCNKKTPLMSGFQCRCGNNFCSSHRYPETHQCTYDFKFEGRKALQESNPVITGSKLPKI